MASKLAALEEVDAPQAKAVKPCSLNRSTQDLVKLIFNNDMFKEAMQSMEIGEHLTAFVVDKRLSIRHGCHLDTKKMPLGKLSKAQIAKGFEVCNGLSI